jgi:transcriptional regulator with XRE-family HTH domain
MKLGKGIRERRSAKGMTLKELAELTELSVSYLSQLERDSISPSLKSLAKIAQALNVPIVSFFLKQNDPPGRVVRREKRIKITLPDTDLQYELLAPDVNRKVEFLLLRVEKGKGQNKLITHEGEEYVFIIQGKLEVKVEKERYVLRAGDSICFDPSFPHTFNNMGEEEIIGVIAASPPSLYKEVKENRKQRHL